MMRFFTRDTKGYIVVGIKVWNFGLKHQNKMSFILKNAQTKIVEIIEHRVLFVCFLEKFVN